MGTLRFSLFFVLLLAGCSESPRLMRLANHINSRHDADEMNKKHDDYFFITYSILTNPKTSEFIHCDLGYDHTITTLTKLPIGATYKDSMHNCLYKVIGRREITFYTGTMLAFGGGPSIDHKADSIKEYFHIRFTEGTNYYSMLREMSLERATFGNSKDGNGTEYFFADETNAKLIEEIRHHEVGDVFTFSDEPGGCCALHRIIKKLNYTGPAIETIVVKIEKYMEDNPL
jgi:hypothetical protein